MLPLSSSFFSPRMVTQYTLPLFHFSLSPCFLFLHPSPPPGPLLHFESLPACLHYSVTSLLFTCLICFGFFPLLFFGFFFPLLCWNSISWLFDSPLSSSLSLPLIQLSFPNLFFCAVSDSLPFSPPLVITPATWCWHYVLSPSVLTDQVTWPCQQKMAKLQKKISSGDFSSQTFHLKCSRLE